MQLGEVGIEQIELDPTSRDDIPQVLRGLQHLYCTPELREEVFKILASVIPEEISADIARPGMELWKILVLGTLRLCLNWDYDRETWQCLPAVREPRKREALPSKV